MCISTELFMPCFVFNTPYFNGNAARHKSVKTPLPPEHPSLAGEFMAKSSPLRQKLRGARLDPRWNSAPSCLTHHLILSAFGRCDTADMRCLTRSFLSTCPVTWSYGSAFHLSPSRWLLRQPTRQNLLPKSKVLCIVKVQTLCRCHVRCLNRTAAGNSHRENPRLFVTVVWWFLLKPGVGVKSSLPLTLQPCGLCVWQLPAL